MLGEFEAFLALNGMNIHQMQRAILEMIANNTKHLNKYFAKDRLERHYQIMSKFKTKNVVTMKSCRYMLKNLTHLYYWMGKDSVKDLDK